MNKLSLTILVSLTGLILFGIKETLVSRQNYKIKIIQNYSDTTAYRNKKILHEFSDTLLLDRFLSEIIQFEIDDSINSGREVDVVFTGSSSIRKWETLKHDMPNYNILNRGFGGSTIPEVIYYSDILLFKHKPSKIVFYAGENDISVPNASKLKVFQSFIYFQKLIKKQLPAAHLYFVSIKPSPGRWNLWPKMNSLNETIKVFCDSTEKCSFIDISTPMFTKSGELKKDIFKSDKTHLNEEGYKIWVKTIGSALECKVNEGL